jgi:hypothetical protein
LIGRFYGSVQNYLEGTAQGSAKAHNFTLGTPIAVFGGIDGYQIVHQHQCVIMADVNAQSAAVALFLVYDRHLNHG